MSARTSRPHRRASAGRCPRLPPTALETWREHGSPTAARSMRTPGCSCYGTLVFRRIPGTSSRANPQRRAAAQRLGYPVVLKTAVAGIDHKSDLNGVYLDIKDETQLRAAYQDLSRRIGPRVLVAPMIEAKGVEMLLGMIHDEQFGPVVVLGFGGVHVEALADVVYALPPFDVAEAHRLVDRLQAQRFAAQSASQASVGDR